MGRGRAKAKQTKVARELKYSRGAWTRSGSRPSSPGQPVTPSSAAVDDDEDDFEDPYAPADDDER